MKIGIITFHWATNYGAILQTYALQTYLKKMGHDIYIINYRPKEYKKTLFRCFFKKRFWLFLSNIKEYIKEMKLDTFRQKYLNETILYNSQEELKMNPPQLNLYICGSDQIWNPYFTTKGEGKPTSAYFLDFGGEYVKRIAYAVSFGCEIYPIEASDVAKKYISKFQAISVREESGLSMVKQLGYENPIKLPDPTLLLSREDYSFANTNKKNLQKKAFIYILRDEYEEVDKIVSFLKRDHIIDTSNNFFNPNSIEDWLRSIEEASIVITNSFHGMIFSLIYHVPFILLTAKGISAGMNDRFKTVLSDINLEHRIMNDYTTEKINELLEEKFNWDKIDNQLSKLKIDAKIFFNKNLN